MAAYCRVNYCGLTACTPGSAPGPTTGSKYGNPLSFLEVVVASVNIDGLHLGEEGDEHGLSTNSIGIFTRC